VMTTYTPPTTEETTIREFLSFVAKEYGAVLTDITKSHDRHEKLSVSTISFINTEKALQAYLESVK